MTTFDMRTIVFSNVVTDVVCMLVVLWLWHQSRKRFAGTGYWVSDFACQTVAMFLIIMRGSIPDWMSIVLANTLVIEGVILGYIGLGRFVGKKISQVHNYVLLAAFVCVHVYFTFVQPNQAARNLNISAGVLMICFQCTWFLLYRIESGMRRLTLGVGLVFGAYSLVSIVRIIEFFTGTHAAEDYFQSQSFQPFILTSYQILFILLTYSLALMVNKRLLVEVKTEEEKFAKAFRSSPYAITLTRLSDGQIIEVNDSFSRITGYPYAEVIGKTPADLRLWDQEEDRRALVDELSKNGKVRGREFQFRKKSGERITGLLSAEVIRINDQQSLLSSISDITELKQVEVQLKEVAEKYSALFNANFDGVWIQNLTGEILEVNDAYCRMSGYSRHELIHMPISRIAVGKTPEEIVDHIKRVIATDGHDRFESRHRRKDGSIFDVDITALFLGKDRGSIAIFVRDITERKRAEQALRESEERYRHLVKYAPAGIYEIDFTTGRFTEVNDAMCQILGYTRDELLSMTAFNILDDEGRARFASRIRLGQSGGRPNETAEYLVRAKDGRLIWGLLNVTFRWKDDKIVGATVVAYDITERKRAEEALRENQALLNAIMESTPDPVYVKDDQSRIVMANPALAKVVGKPLEEILGRTDSEYYGDPVTGQTLREHDLRVMQSGQIEVTEETVPTPVGYRTFLSSKTPYRNASGGIIGITGISRDITERKRAEEELRDSEEQLRLAQEAGRIGVWDFNFGTEELRWTPELEAIYGLEPGSVRTYQDFATHVHPDDLKTMETKRNEAVNQQETFEYEFRIQRPRGETAWVYCRGGATYDLAGRPTRVFGVNIDITERKRAEEALKKSHDELEKRVQERTSELAESVERLRLDNLQRKWLEETLRESEKQVRFFASQCLTAQETERKRVAGELHDSIAAALGATKIRIDRIAEEMKQGHSSLESLQDLGSKVTEINNDVRRIMADLRPSILDDLGIIAAMNWFCREYQKTYAHISVEKQIDLPENDVTDSLKTPIFRISQEAMNNIAKHGKASLVNLSLRKEGDKILLTIRDNGQGFDLETVRRGLGLSTMKERAELSGGSFNLESREGKGTIIRATWTI